jgi:hypothetical protein
VQHLATLGETVEDSKVVGKFLRSVPYCYQQIVVEIQTLLDVNKLTLANVIGRLKAVEEEPEVLPLMVNHTNNCACRRRHGRKDGSSVTPRSLLATGRAVEVAGNIEDA